MGCLRGCNSNPLVNVLSVLVACVVAFVVVAAGGGTRPRKYSTAWLSGLSIASTGQMHYDYQAVVLVVVGTLLFMTEGAAGGTTVLSASSAAGVVLLCAVAAVSARRRYALGAAPVGAT